MDIEQPKREIYKQLQEMFPSIETAYKEITGDAIGVGHVNIL